MSQIRAVLATAINKELIGTEAADVNIRSWGCDLQQTPLLFIHLGKTGGEAMRTQVCSECTECHEKNGGSRMWFVLPHRHRKWKTARGCGVLYA
jgi:hypothetical protein